MLRLRIDNLESSCYEEKNIPDKNITIIAS